MDIQRLPPLEALAHQVSQALAEIRDRLTKLETRTDTLMTRIGRDGEETARIARGMGIHLADLKKVGGEGKGGASANRLFVELRRRGWSYDRIARGTGYSARGVHGNLRRFNACV